MGCVRNKIIKKAARSIVEKYFQRLDNTFEHNIMVVHDVAEIQSKKIANELAGYITTLYKRIQSGENTHIYVKSHEDEKEKRENFIPKDCLMDTEIVEVDSVTMNMLKKYGFMGNFKVSSGRV